MGVSINTRQAYSEIDEFLGLLNNEQINKIPQELRELFRKEKDSNYKKGINTKLPIKEQSLKEETLAIIAVLNLQYWCENKKEKERLKKIYDNNEKIYQELFRTNLNLDDIFKKKISNNEAKQEARENIQIVEYKESVLKIILKRVLKFFEK